jgi:hypothetical protein
LSPQPLPGFGVVVDVLGAVEELDDVEVDVLVDELVDVVRVEVELVVEVEVDVGVVVEVVRVVVEQNWSCAGSVQYWYW